jgi:predicted DNA-binding protein (MmcQ/YjbR family)
MPELDPLAEAETFLRDRALRYPEAKEEFPWGHRAIKVKGKVFVFLHQIDGTLTAGMKLPDSSSYALMQRYAKPTEYGLGKHGWVTCTFRPGDDVPLDLLEEWVEESYRAIAPKKLLLLLNAREAGEPEPAPTKPKRGPKTKKSRKS